MTRKLDTKALDDLAAAVQAAHDLVEAVRGLRFTPAGADSPLAPVPVEVQVTGADVDRAVASWDRFAEGEDADLVGLLESDVVNRDA